MEKLTFTIEEKKELFRIIRYLHASVGNSLEANDVKMLKKLLRDAIVINRIQRNIFGLNPILLNFQTAALEVEEIGMKRECVIAILLYNIISNTAEQLGEIESLFGHGVAQIIHGLARIGELYSKKPIIESENFKNLLLSFAEDLRVILIMITDRVNLMRQIRDAEDTEDKTKVAEEASYLYAPLAHQLGLYKLKSELEDLSLKYLEHDAYYMIKDKLNATKRSRDAYIDNFISPIKKVLDEMHIKCHIKGRTKSIHSIWQKMKASTTSLPFALSSIRRLTKRRCYAGRPTPSSPTCICQTRNVCAIGCRCLRATDTNVCISPSWDLKTNGWRCRYAPNAWTK